MKRVLTFITLIIGVACFIAGIVLFILHFTNEIKIGFSGLFFSLAATLFYTLEFIEYLKEKRKLKDNKEAKNEEENKNDR